MFGGYDPAYNPENLEKKKIENKELDPQQAAMANKWSEAMEDVPEQGGEAEPTIPETEPQLQANLAEGMAAEEADAATELPTDENSPDEPAEKNGIVNDVVAEGAKIAVDATIQNPVESHIADAAIDAVHDAIESHEEEKPADAEQPAEASSIQHFAPDTTAESTFSPLSPEEQQAGKIAAEAAHGKTYTEPGEADTPHVVDEDNLVAREVGSNLGEGNLDLNSVGQKLEGEGVDIQGEVESLNTDIAEDLAAATTAGNVENEERDAVTANNLAVEGASSALAAKEAAGEAIEEAKHGSDDALEKIEKANELANQAVELANTSEEVAISAGSTVATEAISDTQEMAKEAQDLAAKADEIAKKADEEKAENGGKDPAETDDDPDDGKNVFSADEYPELKDLDNGEAKTITG